MNREALRQLTDMEINVAPEAAQRLEEEDIESERWTYEKGRLDSIRTYQGLVAQMLLTVGVIPGNPPERLFSDESVYTGEYTDE